MISDLGTVEAVKRLMHRSKPPDGFVTLWEKNRLDLSMENIIQEPEWKDLFTKEELEEAKKRLEKHGYEVK
jgi:hypothetical protein